MHLEYTNDEIEHKKLLERIKTLTDEDKSEWVWEGKSLYLLGRGHAFGRGFFVEYTTLDATIVRRFGDRWFCNGEEYKFDEENNEFIEVVVEIQKPRKIDWDSFSFPCSIKIDSCTIGDKLTPVQPMSGPKNKEDEKTK